MKVDINEQLCADGILEQMPEDVYKLKVSEAIELASTLIEGKDESYEMVKVFLFLIIKRTVTGEKCDGILDGSFVFTEVKLNELIEYVKDTCNVMIPLYSRYLKHVNIYDFVCVNICNTWIKEQNNIIIVDEL